MALANCLNGVVVACSFRFCESVYLQPILAIELIDWGLDSRQGWMFLTSQQGQIPRTPAAEAQSRSGSWVRFPGRIWREF